MLSSGEAIKMKIKMLAEEEAEEVDDEWCRLSRRVSEALFLVCKRASLFPFDISTATFSTGSVALSTGRTTFDHALFT